MDIPAAWTVRSEQKSLTVLILSRSRMGMSAFKSFLKYSSQNSNLQPVDVRQREGDIPRTTPVMRIATFTSFSGPPV